jgi:hypothetical protein
MVLSLYSLQCKAGICKRKLKIWWIRSFIMNCLLITGIKSMEFHLAYYGIALPVLSEHDFDIPNFVKLLCCSVK